MDLKPFKWQYALMHPTLLFYSVQYQTILLLKEKFNVSTISRLITSRQGPLLETLNFSIYFSGDCIPTNQGWIYWGG
jgi:hypothetical protein